MKAAGLEGMKGLEVIEKDATVSQWLKGSGLKEKTIPGYLVGIRYFCIYTGKMPKELIEEAEKEIENGILMRKRKIKQYLSDFPDWLKEYRKKTKGKEIAPKTLHRYMAAIRSFYTYHEIDLPKGIRNHSAKATRENTRFLDKEIIKKALKYSNIRSRAVILTMIASGISDVEVRNLRVKDFLDGYDPETGITTLKLRRKKTEVDFITFLTPEASQAILDYLEYRDRKPDLNKYKGCHKIIVGNAYEKRRIRDKNNYLFIKEFVPQSYLNDYDEEKRKMTHVSIQTLFRHLSEKAGVDGDRNKDQWRLLRGHNLRKFFNSQLRNEGADHFMIEFWMGHKIPEEQAAYFHASPEKLKKIYMKYMNVLEIQRSEVKIIETDEYKELKKENQELKEKLMELEQSKDKQLGEMLIRALENNPKIAKELTELLIKKIFEKNPEIGGNLGNR